MRISTQGSLYRLAKRLSIGRGLRYLDLWARYLWRRGQSRLDAHRGRLPGADLTAPATAIAEADMTTAKRMTVASWFPLDLANSRLHRALLASIAEARPDLSLSEAKLNCIARLKRGNDLAVVVDELVASGETAETINTALYVHLLRRLPAPSELPMIGSRHPRHALIAIRSGDEYRKQGRKMLAS